MSTPRPLGFEDCRTREDAIDHFRVWWQQIVDDRRRALETELLLRGADADELDALRAASDAAYAETLAEVTLKMRTFGR